MTSKTDERARSAVERMPWPAKRLTLLCWLLVLTLAVSAECAWLVWLQDAWTEAPTGARPHRLLPVGAAERISQWAANSEE